jgi:hypothetical protein
MMNHLQESSGLPQPDAIAVPCDQDAVGALKQMFVDVVMGRRIAAGQQPALRPVFLKQHGVALGTFTVRADLPADLRVGVFAHHQFPAIVRFSSDTLPRNPDFQSTVGVAIKLLGVPGKKLLIPDAHTVDFLLQNHDVFFVDTARDMCEFTRAGVIDNNYAAYLQSHPTTARILEEMNKLVPSVLLSTYWGLLPHAFGLGRFVKYKLAPSPGNPTAGIQLDPRSTPNYLYVDLKSRLLRGAAEFGLYVQFRNDDSAMPLDQATVRWEESVSPPIHVATLTLPAQNIDAPGQAQLETTLAFNIWQTLAEHEPQGSVALARRMAYYSAAELRRTQNHVSTEEPTQPQFDQAAMPTDATIVRAEIHPAIGVARVGNSQDEYFIGPEVTHPRPETPGCYRDAAGALKRQAARFRIYGYNASGEAVAELTADNATIEWTVHVANKKAAWYNFTLAMDDPAVREPQVEQARRRNSNLQGADRQQLVIDPGPRSIHGRDTSGSTYHFNTGKFFGQPVYLGELRTDDAGRLIFLGGRGVSRSAFGGPPLDFANNDGWHDDVSDGPVSARVWIGEREIDVESAWVVVGPPNYAPQLKSVRTLYDLLDDVPAGTDPGEVSFTQHILPVFDRLCGLQWVNRGFAEEFGWRGAHEFLRPDYLARLAAPRDTPGRPRNDELRQQILGHFRSYESNNGWRGLWPWIYGDAMDVAGALHIDSVLSNLQLARLAKWAAGDFKSDYDPSFTPPDTLAAVPLSDQPAMLTQAALDFCLADAFHPGCEITWTVRYSFLYRSPFRFKQRPTSLPEPDYGEVLTPQTATSSSGPLNALGPGDLTRWMAVPWQTDTASCRAGYRGNNFTPATPAFWPARVPNHVLTNDDFTKVIDKTLSLDERHAAFRRRINWFLTIGTTYYEQLGRMIDEFGNLGVVEPHAGPGDAGFPAHIYVATPAPSATAGVATTFAAMAPASAVAAGEDESEFIPKAHRYLRRE